MSLLTWISPYLFDCVYPHTTWPHQDQVGQAYVCCLDCGRETPYSFECMQIVGQNRRQNIWGSRPRATASLIIVGALLLLTPSHAIGESARPSADQSQTMTQQDVLADFYYPPSNRGTGLVFVNFAVGTAERNSAGLDQRFILAKFTKTTSSKSRAVNRSNRSGSSASISHH